MSQLKLGQTLAALDRVPFVLELVKDFRDERTSAGWPLREMTKSLTT
jgi:hypothetical protein